MTTHESASRQAGKRYRFLRYHRICAFLLILMICCIGLEVGVRMLGLAPKFKSPYSNFSKSPYLTFGPRPGSERSGSNDEFDYHYVHNQFGLRGEDIELEKPKGTFRILGVGDSFTYGVGARVEETYLSRLQAMLNENRSGIEVINAGVPRFFPETERLFLEKLGMEFSPDLITVGFLPNDVIDTALGLDSIIVNRSGHLISRRAQKLGAVGFFLFKYSHACRLVLKKTFTMMDIAEYQPSWDDVYKADGHHEDAWQTVEAEYAKMADLASEAGAKLIIIHIPQQDMQAEGVAYPGDRLRAWADAHQVGFVDCLPALREAEKTKQVYYPKDGHCTPAGYQVIANELAQYLESEGLLP